MLAALLCQRPTTVAVTPDGGWPPYDGLPHGQVYVIPTEAQMRARADKRRRKRDDEEYSS